MINPRLANVSLWFFLLGVVFNILPCIYAFSGPPGFDRLERVLGGLIVAFVGTGLLWLISLITGILATRQRKLVLVWTLPLLILALWLASFYFIELVILDLGEKFRFYDRTNHTVWGISSIFFVIISIIVVLCFLKFVFRNELTTSGRDWLGAFQERK